MFDVIIIGAGPAGLTAGIILGRCRRKVLICDSGSYRNSRSKGLHFFLTREGIAPSEFLRLGREELKKYPTVEYRNGTVLDAKCIDSGFEIHLKNEGTEQTRKLLLATGIKDLLPEIPGVKEYYGKSIFHCPYCDGWEVRDYPMAIYGRGQRGKGLALELTAWSKNLLLCTDGPSELDDEALQKLQANGIQLIEKRIRGLEGRDGNLEAILFEDGSRAPRRAMFFSLGQRQGSDLPVRFGCDFNPKSAVRTGKHEETHIRGLYIAGDASEAVQFAVVAAAEGAQAAFSIHQELLEEDLK